MTMVLTYLDDLSRVRIALSAITPDGAVRVEKAALTADPPWAVVRGATQLPIVSGVGQVDDYEFYADVANWYRVLRVDPVPGLALDGTSGSYASTPDSAPLDVVGDIDLRIDATLDDWLDAGIQTLIAKYNSSDDQRSYRLLVENGGLLVLEASEDGVVTNVSQSSTVPVEPPEDGRLTVRGTLDVDDGNTRLLLPGNSGDFASTPHSAALGITGDLDIRADITPTAWDQVGFHYIVAKWDFAANERAYTLRLDDGVLELAWSTDGVVVLVESADAAIPAADGERLAVRGTLDVSTGDVTFYTADTIAGPWTQLGTVQTGSATSINNSTVADLDIFSADSGTAGVTSGDVHAIEVYDGIDGTVVANPDFAAESSGTTSFDDDAGNTWTVHGDAEITADHVVTFYTASTLDGPWVLLESFTLVGSTSIFAGTASLNVGATQNDGSGSPLSGRVHAAEVRDGIGGTAVASPDFAVQADDITSFDDAAGNTWTINGTAVLLGGIVEEAQSITPDLGGITWLKSIKYPALNRPLGEAPEYRPVQRSSRTGVYNIKGRVPPIAIYDAWTSRWWTMEFVTNTLAEARDIDLILAASRTLFVHAPAESENECFTNPVSGMPGGYVMAQNATMRHTVGGSHVMQWILPVREVAPPAPEISGTTATWNTLKRLYGSWEALWASNATWRDVWDLIGEPEDFINL